MAKRHHRFSHEQVVFFQALAAGLPAVAISLILLWIGGYSAKLQWTLGLLIVGCWLGFAAAVQVRVIRPLQTMANLLSALREGDFSVRARDARRDEPLGDVMAEINTLSRTLQEQRLSALEATALLRTVMEEIEVAVFAFDAEGKLRLANHAGQLLLNKPAERILGRGAAELGLEECLTGEPTRILATTFPGGSGRWGMRRSLFREGGRPHHLIVIADLSRTLREEELRAWQRLVRVLGHELNNSLAPIKSIAGSLGSILKREQRAPDWEDDMRSGLEIIASRAEGLSRFMQAYARLARLPAPSRAPCEVAPLVSRVTALETRRPVTVVGGPPLTLSCDAAQIEQVLINLLKNAVDAVLEAATAGRENGGICVEWKKLPGQIEIAVVDDGPGIANSGNLFVPFFTTKPEGSGIGLVLCRQIAENHGGTLTLESRDDGHTGSVARLRLPI
ncbi:sensor histidine kinase [Opitutus terrae]|uniref:histidine kinase n=1 Tax=Opitutus terrae (strain DSM 11246 / JCM 15787 / PB90-1) TaxID=452637 RepID=B1ZXY3_OPITP|nr:ATP-binding protein [Opitutus terrae]ACB75185.1 multi-sensor signal transduction histidine kinase [Opitutus terrae PB90-1]